MPETAKEFSKEGLIAFTEYWYATLGYAFETGDAEPMMAVTGPDCPTCEVMNQAVQAWHSEGRWIVGGQMFVLSQDTSFVPLQSGNYQVVAMVRQQQVQYYRGDKSLAEDKGPKAAVGDIMEARYEPDGWIAVTVSHIRGSTA